MCVRENVLSLIDKNNNFKKITINDEEYEEKSFISYYKDFNCSETPFDINIIAMDLINCLKISSCDLIRNQDDIFYFRCYPYKKVDKVIIKRKDEKWIIKYYDILTLEIDKNFNLIEK